MTIELPHIDIEREKIHGLVSARMTNIETLSIIVNPATFVLIAWVTGVTVSLSIVNAFTNKVVLLDSPFNLHMGTQITIPLHITKELDGEYLLLINVLSTSSNSIVTQKIKLKVDKLYGY